MKKSLPEFYCPYSNECYQCCLDTEMTLSEEDITRIEKLGYKIEEFLEEKDGFMALRNIDNHCIFLKNKMCSIYEIRPQGCRFYPLIYDIN
ncbi:MAG: YkgJ family cysteine cluster protein, partial [Candidatus Heimdallarchaeota archaeon]|nr:YkgJ family cysteine cluster protein [Candidatus Heimdallarchaeota archaeon]